MNIPVITETENDPVDISKNVRPLEGLQVLLVEDCADQGRLYLHFLQRAGADVTLECNGSSAVETVKKSQTPFDAVVMDFQMPELDGLEATKKLRELEYGGAIIAVTAYETQELSQRWFLAGCDEFLEKPFDEERLIGAIVKHIATPHEIIKDSIMSCLLSDSMINISKKRSL